VTAIGNKAFCGCTGLKDVYCYIADISRVSIEYDIFYLEDYNYSGRTLHVLQGTADDYQWWNDVDWSWCFENVVDDLIPETLSGDVNGDRVVNIVDVNAVISVVLGDNHIPAADVNGDGSVNITDINAVINIILRGT